MRENLFSYGTLQKAEVQMKLFGRLLTGAKDVLKNHKTAAVAIKEESFLAQGEGKYQLTVTHSNDENDRIEGTVFELTQAELLSADEYEPENYRRIRVKLDSGKNVRIYAALEII